MTEEDKIKIKEAIDKAIIWLEEDQNLNQRKKEGYDQYYSSFKDFILPIFEKYGIDIKYI